LPCDFFKWPRTNFLNHPKLEHATFYHHSLSHPSSM
jgi:hypothetical protein